MDMLRVLSYIGNSILCINIFIYFTGFSRNGKAYRFFTLYLLAIGIIQAIIEYYAHKGYNNHFLSNYYLFARFTFLSAFFYYLFYHFKKNISRTIKFITVGVILALAVQYGVHPEEYYKFNSLGFLVTSALLVVYAVFYLYEMLTQKLPFVYVTTGIFLYILSSAVIFAAGSYLISPDDEINMFIWRLNAFLFILYQLLILWEWKTAFYKRRPKQGQ